MRGEKWRLTEAHKLDPATVACHRLLSKAANSIIRLIVSAINFNPDMKEFEAGVGVYVANYTRSLRPVIRAPGQDTGHMPETSSSGRWVILSRG